MQEQAIYLAFYKCCSLNLPISPHKLQQAFRLMLRLTNLIIFGNVKLTIANPNRNYIY